LAAFAFGGVEALDGVFQETEGPGRLSGDGLAATGQSCNPAGGAEVVVPAAGAVLHFGELLDEGVVAGGSDAVGELSTVAGALDPEADEVQVGGFTARLVFEDDVCELLKLSGEPFDEGILRIVKAAFELLAETANVTDELVRTDSAGFSDGPGEGLFATPGEKALELSEAARVEAGRRLGKGHLEDVEIANFAKGVAEFAQAAAGHLGVGAIEPGAHDEEGLIETPGGDARAVDGIDFAGAEGCVELISKPIEAIEGVGD